MPKENVKAVEPIEAEARKVLKVLKVDGFIKEIKVSKVEIDKQSLPACYVTFESTQDIPEPFADANEMYSGYVFSQWTTTNKSKVFNLKPTTRLRLFEFLNAECVVVAKALEFSQFPASWV